MARRLAILDDKLRGTARAVRHGDGAAGDGAAELGPGCRKALVLLMNSPLHNNCIMLSIVVGRTTFMPGEGGSEGAASGCGDTVAAAAVAAALG